MNQSIKQITPTKHTQQIQPMRTGQHIHTYDNINTNKQDIHTTSHTHTENDHTIRTNKGATQQQTGTHEGQQQIKHMK